MVTWALDMENGMDGPWIWKMTWALWIWKMTWALDMENGMEN
jgi:hypothetical protein